MSYVKPLDELEQSSLPLAGGKGANLGALLQAGFPVPPGFCITTDAYRAFVDANRLQEAIQQACANLRADDPAALEGASTTIRARFAAGQIPTDIATEVRDAYGRLNQTITQSPNHPMPVAVRSSATAEDLPDMSFAGQQDTYLHIIGEEALLTAIIDCWGSLWTARAIGYRARNDIPPDDVALAVVVQQMIPSEASGVLFTANPLTGKRGEIVIDATLGLGEALVSGQVEPDHYVVGDEYITDGNILSKTLGAKAISIRGQSGGGTQTVTEDASTQQALPDAAILELAQLGRRIEQAFGSPQDIEWAWASGKLAIVQSRPVTSLYPLPEGMSAEPPAALFSFGVWQGMLDPYTSAGRDVFDSVVAGAGTIFGVKVEPARQRVMLTAGERIFVDISGMLRNSVGRTVISTFVNAVDPASGSIIQKLMEDQSFAAAGG